MILNVGESKLISDREQSPTSHILTLPNFLINFIAELSKKFLALDLLVELQVNFVRPVIGL